MRDLLALIFTTWLVSCVILQSDALLSVRQMAQAVDLDCPRTSVVISRPWSRDSSSFCPGLGLDLETWWPTDPVVLVSRPKKGLDNNTDNLTLNAPSPGGERSEQTRFVRLQSATDPESFIPHIVLYAVHSEINQQTKSTASHRPIAGKITVFSSVFKRGICCRPVPVRPSVTLVHRIHAAEYRPIVKLLGRPIILVFLIPSAGT